MSCLISLRFFFSLKRENIKNHTLWSGMLQNEVCNAFDARYFNKEYSIRRIQT